jgi:acyl carrier protein
MTEAELRTTVLRALRAIAPEVPSEQIQVDADLREQLDIDSMDFVNLLTALEEELGVRIEQVEHTRLRTLNDIVARLCAAQGRATGSGAAQ